ncbi:MAG: FAD-dependent oxidoreductase [Methylotenera sp.]|nr:FAD-dependent oxidoreductase [Methylotenera sp.]
MTTIVKPHIVILGAGFAALTAARDLRKKAPNARITLVAPQATFVYQPSLIWIPTGLRKGSDLTMSLQGFLARHRLEFFAARVTGLANGGRTVITDQGQLDNDALLIASGGRFMKRLPGIENALTLCEGIAAAEAIRDRLESMDGGHIAIGFGTNPAESSAMRGGPMFELLLGLDTWLRRQGKRERFTLTFFNAAAEPGKRLGEKAVAKLLGEMQQRGIATHLGKKITGFSTQGVETEGGHIPAELILFMPGLTGPEWAKGSGLPLSEGGFIRGDEYCQVPDSDMVYIAGDAGSFPGPDWMPKQGHMADLQAKVAVINLLRSLSGKPPAAKFRAELICIVDTLDSGILVYRDTKRAQLFPSSVVWHWLKRLFEHFYLYKYRR